ncbi:protein BatD [Kaistella flava (ex Peng et al. 2021)]|uniref:Protein BatD n=1 Tax=Kaistella flava (ex Peng et al. 2021) TaxID=2038776 RepID=A0A7M2YDM2_9FLAO|nr:BatD family protein [Kaistella flava (ex Peng et al. 2021)]QOW11734.1 protein BatD [Kaistella flava (ex Peng et al. 2021)]
MKQQLSYILFIFSAVFTYGQVTLAISDVKDQRVNQRFTLTILLEISGENMEQQTPLQMPDLSKFDIIGTASDRNTIVLDAKKGDVINQLVYQCVLSPKQVGKVKIGSALVTVNGKIYKTEPFDINVRDSDRSNSVADNSDRNNMYLNLEVQDKVVYKNEPTIAILRAYSRNYDNFRKLGKLHFPYQQNANIKPVSFAKSDIESNAGMASQVIGVFIIFPSETGNVEINPISASFANSSKDNRISSNKVQLNVKKLPVGMPGHFKNAVGQFTVDLFNPITDIIPEIEKPLHIILKVAGSGNLGSLHLPKILNSSDYVFFPPKITSQTIAKKNGLSGFVSAEYIIVPKKSGPISIKFEDFSYFDPETKKYSDLGSKELLINVKTPAQIAEEKSTLEKVNDYTNTVLETVNTPVLQTQNFKVKDKNKIDWKIVIGNLALLMTFISLFLIVLKRREKRKLKPQLISSPITTIADTEEVIRKNLNNHFEESIEYLKILKDNKDFTNFFSAYTELNRETKESYYANTDSDFRTILEQTKGQQISEQYRTLSERIQIEKFAPLHSEEQMNDLYNSIHILYSEISK